MPQFTPIALDTTLIAGFLAALVTYHLAYRQGLVWGPRYKLTVGRSQIIPEKSLRRAAGGASYRFVEPWLTVIGLPEHSNYDVMVLLPFTLRNTSRLTIKNIRIQIRYPVRLDWSDIYETVSEIIPSDVDGLVRRVSQLPGSTIVDYEIPLLRSDETATLFEMVRYSKEALSELHDTNIYRGSERAYTGELRFDYHQVSYFVSSENASTLRKRLSVVALNSPGLQFIVEVLPLLTRWVFQREGRRFYARAAPGSRMFLPWWLEWILTKRVEIAQIGLAVMGVERDDGKRVLSDLRKHQMKELDRKLGPVLKEKLLFESMPGKADLGFCDCMPGIDVVAPVVDWEPGQSAEPTSDEESLD